MDLPSTAAGLERRVGVLAERPGRSRAQPVLAWSGREIRCWAEVSGGFRG